MKHLYILITVLLLVCPSAQASWSLFSKDPDPVPELKQKITALENQVSAQAITVDHWQITAGCLGIACLVLFILGTTLGSLTRKHYDSSTTPMGRGRRTPDSTHNHAKARLNGQSSQKNGNGSLATPATPQPRS